MKKPLLLILLGALIVGLFASTLYWQSVNAKVTPPELETTLLPQPRPVQPFQLTDQENAPFTADRFQGKWTLLFFGYTQCPDICPTTLLTLNKWVQHLKGKNEWRDGVQVVFVSVDPKRDSPQHMKAFLSYFDPAYLGMTGERTQIDALVKQFSAIYMFEGDTKGESYTVNHSASLYVIDPKGRFYAKMVPPYEPAEMADTFVRLRNFYSR